MDSSPAPFWLDAAALRAALPLGEAIDALAEQLRSGQPPRAAPRTVLDTDDGGELLTMPATGATGTGVKLVTIQRANPARGMPLIHGVYVLFASDALTPRAFLDGAELTRIRTPAVSALAARSLARGDAASLVVFGSGVQARGHIVALRLVRPIERVTIVDPVASASADELAAQLRRDGVDARIGEATAIADADLVCCCTTASEPLFAGTLLRPGTHVTAMGSYQPHTRELDTTTVARSRVAVEDREAALSEAGDLIIPIEQGAIAPEHVLADLTELVRGAPVRVSPSDITLFKSVGVAFEDLILATAAVRRAEG